jgi:hypothetical protein
MGGYNDYLAAAKAGYSTFRKVLKGDEHFIWNKRYAKSLKKFQNIHRGKDCIIIGNGPSLNKMDLSPIRDYYTFGLNKIFMFEKYDLNLSYLAAVNPLVIEQSKTVYEKFDRPIFLSYDNSKGVIDDASHIYRLNSKSLFGFGSRMTEEFYEGGTVTYVAMQLAFAMGFERVALIGIDHNFAQKGAPNSEQKMEKDDENHFHPDYFKGHNWHLADLEANEISYSLAKYQFERSGKKIWDATLNGKLQVFEKIPFEDILKTFKKKD